MKTILLPTDFSLHSEKALEFAIEIAKRSNAEILVTHAFVIPVIDANVPSSIMEEMCEEEMHVVESALQRICQRITKVKSNDGKYLRSNYATDFDLPVSEISKLSHERNVDLIVMGTENDEHFHFLLGSNTSAVFNRVNCPVLVVKENMTFKPFEDIYLTLENVKEDITAIKNLIPFAKLFNAEIKLIHISNYAEKIEDLFENKMKKREGNKILENLKKELEYTDITLKYCFANEPYEGLQRLINSENPDLVALVKYHRNWFDNLFHKSIINSILKKHDLPLLIIQKN